MSGRVVNNITGTVHIQEDELAGQSLCGLKLSIGVGYKPGYLDDWHWPYNMRKRVTCGHCRKMAKLPLPTKRKR